MSDLLYAGNADAPSAGGTIVQSAALTAGRYLVCVTAYLDGGTPAAGTDDSNMGLYSDTTEVGPLAVVCAADVPVVSPWLEVSVAESTKITVEAIADATTGVTYVAQMAVRLDARYQ